MILVTRPLLKLLLPLRYGDFIGWSASRTTRRVLFRTNLKNMSYILKREKARPIKQCKEYILFYPIFRKALPFCNKLAVCNTLMKKGSAFEILDKIIYIFRSPLLFTLFHQPCFFSFAFKRLLLIRSFTRIRCFFLLRLVLVYIFGLFFQAHERLRLRLGSFGLLVRDVHTRDF